MEVSQRVPSIQQVLSKYLERSFFPFSFMYLNIIISKTKNLYQTHMIAMNVQEIIDEKKYPTKWKNLSSQRIGVRLTQNVLMHCYLLILHTGWLLVS